MNAAGTTPGLTPRARRALTGCACAAAILAAIGLSHAGAADPSLKDKIESARSDAGQLDDRISSQTERIAQLTEQARQAGVRAMQLGAELQRSEDRTRELTTKLT